MFGAASSEARRAYYGRVRGWTVHVVAAALAALVLVGASAPGVVAQDSDAAAVISSYALTLNQHNPAAALDLFDEFGSATDVGGRHFEGRDGLRTFLLDSGFAGPDAHIATQGLHVVANRAVWTFVCSCAEGPIEARVVTNQGRIVVFAVVRPAAAPATARNDMGAGPGLIGLGLLAILAGVLVRQYLQRAPAVPPRRHDGRLLAALAARYTRPRA